MAIGNIHKNVTFGCVVLELCKQTKRQPNKQTYSSQYFAPLQGDDITTVGVHLDANDVCSCFHEFINKIQIVLEIILGPRWI